ncbi:MAG: cytochrome c-type biogenesis CcmF C-terminal domain-containing protein, partial [Actinomycetota bacterium]
STLSSSSTREKGTHASSAADAGDRGAALVRGDAPWTSFLPPAAADWVKPVFAYAADARVAPLLAFGFAGFAGGASLRQLVLATRRQGYRGLMGRTNGGMVVHLGVIMVAVALAASNSYTRTGEFIVQKGQSVSFAGHTFTVNDVYDFTTPRAVGIKADISIDGGQAYAPAISKYTAFGMDVATPSVKTSFTKDIYLTLESGSKPSSGTAKIKVFIKPMVVWMWIGGMLCAFGCVLAAFPGRFRRRPTDAVSAPVPLDESVNEETAGV